MSKKPNRTIYIVLIIFLLGIFISSSLAYSNSQEIKTSLRNPLIFSRERNSLIDILSRKTNELEEFLGTLSFYDVYKEFHEIARRIGYIPIEEQVIPIVYTPGVSYVVKAIQADNSLFEKLLGAVTYPRMYKGDRVDYKVYGDPVGSEEDIGNVLVVSDGSACLGLGNVGPKAMGPIADGKCALLKWFGDIKANYALIDTQELWLTYNEVKAHYNKLCKEYPNNYQKLLPLGETGRAYPYDMEKHIENIMEQLYDAEERLVDRLFYEIVAICKARGYRIVMLEDISAPICFQIEDRLNEAGIVTVHDDQHGSAIAFGAALINAAKVAGKEFKDLKVVISGAGASGRAVAMVLHNLGVENIICYDSQGAIYEARRFLTRDKKVLTAYNKNSFRGKIGDALKGADVFIGLSKNEVFHGREVEMLKVMAKDAIVFSTANPNGEFDVRTIASEMDLNLKNIKVVAAGKFGIQGVATINNSSAFPGLFLALVDLLKAGKLSQGLSDATRIDIDEEAAKAIAALVPEDEVTAETIMRPTYLRRRYDSEITQAGAIAVYGAITHNNKWAKKKYAAFANELMDSHGQMIQKLNKEIERKEPSLALDHSL